MNTRRIFSALTALSLVTVALAGCQGTSDKNSAHSSTETMTSQSGEATMKLAPIQKDPTLLDGAEVTLPSERVLVFNVPAEDDATKWMGSIEDATVAEFVPGTKSDKPTIRPLAVTEGTTVTLTNPAGETVTFTLKITEGAN
ncbi:hypothetical protein G7Y41_00615 [Schaalia sp. ZJ405]|uniref:hypothetical protein n=1 Tax=Schaalia sp. ZJ405 TaxID=2709403 RepID=UPI0013ED5F49|nr:hypothetical protein [Schaalia sp. ZJ405]QPK81418.1 hypothetical protein G7Y41_00615 [Schaalia sp. ZJ405]